MRLRNESALIQRRYITYTQHCYIYPLCIHTDIRRISCVSVLIYRGYATDTTPKWCWYVTDTSLIHGWYMRIRNESALIQRRYITYTRQCFMYPSCTRGGYGAYAMCIRGDTWRIYIRYTVDTVRIAIVKNVQSARIHADIWGLVQLKRGRICVYMYISASYQLCIGERIGVFSTSARHHYIS